MNCRSNYIRATVVLLVVTIRYTGISLASGSSLNVIEQAEETTDILHNSTLRNGSAENCGTFPAANNSTVGENITLNVPVRLDNDLKTPPLSVPSLCISLCMCVWSVVANSLPLAAIVKHEQLHTPVYILMANLAASDVLTGTAFGIWCISALAHIYTQSITSNTVTRFFFSFGLLSGLSSAYGLLALTAERYWFIVHGMTYINNVTNDKCKVVVLIAWAWSVLLAMLPNFGWHCASPAEEGCRPLAGGLPHGYTVLVQVSIIIPMAAIILLNSGVFWCLWKLLNAIADQEAAVGAEPSTSRRSAITIVIITIVFLLGWLPTLIRMASSTVVSMPIIYIVLNSAINPVIYGFRLLEVRRSVARLFVCGQ
ncbi:lysophosphatidic acid receptor 3-like [Branchiostoma lanceolatum]|uniref:lysophosphatidic acid receptor 3-like n=1 Tax=Branchiostoma lanceolatum TaxID=7740 RepID=UPI0034540EFC